MLFIVFLFACENNNSITEPSSDEYQTQLKQIVNESWESYIASKPDYPGGYSLQVISSDNEYYAASGELKDSDNQIHFRGASTTKTYTAAGILLLHQRGLLNINNFITDAMPGKQEPYVPDTETFNIPYKNQITIKLLLQNRSGVFDLINTDIPDTISADYAGTRYADYIIEGLGQTTHTFTTDEMLGILAKHNLCYFEPGEKFHYSDTGFNLLGYIIERVSGQRYDQFITENLLIPNELTETTFPYKGDDVSIPAMHAAGSLYYLGETYDVTENNRSMHFAEGNVITTPHDLTKWIKLLLSGEAGIDRKYIQFLMMDCQPTYESHQYYGLGCVFTPGLGYGHNGGTIGYFTVSRYDPEMDLAFTIFTNVWDYDAMLVDMYTQVFDMYDAALQAKQLLK